MIDHKLSVAFGDFGVRINSVSHKNDGGMAIRWDVQEKELVVDRQAVLAGRSLARSIVEGDFATVAPIETRFHAAIANRFVALVNSPQIDLILCSKAGEERVPEAWPSGPWLDRSDSVDDLATKLAGAPADDRGERFVFVPNGWLVIGVETVDRLRQVLSALGEASGPGPEASSPDTPVTGRAMTDACLPYLRGLTFDGRLAMFVRVVQTTAAMQRAKHVCEGGAQPRPLTFGEARFSGCEMLVLDGGDTDPQGRSAVDVSGEQDPVDIASRMAATWKESYQKYVATYGHRPGLVAVRGIGLLAIAATVAELEAAERAVVAASDVWAELRAADAERYCSRAVAESLCSHFRENAEIAGRLAVAFSGRVDDGLVRSEAVRNKVCIVTGGAQGFGERFVRNIAASEALVFVADLNIDGATRLTQELNATAGKTVAIPLQVDIANEDSVRAMISSIVASVGGVDLFVSNAGVVKAGSVKELDTTAVNWMLAVNFTGYLLCAKHCARMLQIQNAPSGNYYTDIIQINSKSGLTGSNKNGVYAGSKFGGVGLTQSFALELVEDNVKVNAICPGNYLDGPLWSDPEKGVFVQYLKAGKVPGAKTTDDVRRFYEEKVPMRRGCKGEDVIRAIYYIVEQKYETGQAVPVTGGQEMLN